MTNGFYNTDNLSEEAIRGFIDDAIDLSYNVYCQSIVGWQRQLDKKLSVKKFINDALDTTDYKLYVIDRFAYNEGIISKDLCEYEICLTYNSNFLYVFVNEENFNKLINRYDLKLKEWK